MNTPILIKKTIFGRFGRIWNRNNFFMSKKKKKCRAEPVINLVYDFGLQNVHKKYDKILSTIAIEIQLWLIIGQIRYLLAMGNTAGEQTR